MESAWVYNVKTEIVFDISLSIIGEEVEKEITRWIYESFSIPEYIQEEVVVGFNYEGKKVTASFEFEICDDSKDEAESYADYCIRRITVPLGIKYCNHSREAKELYLDRH